MAAGIAYGIIQQNRLWKHHGCTSFQSYIEQKINERRSYVYYLIAAARVVCNLHDCGQFTVLPTCEWQVRHMVTLTAEEQIAVWHRVVDNIPPDKITAPVIASYVLAYMREQAIQTPDEPSDSEQRPTEAPCPDQGGGGRASLDDENGAGGSTIDAESVLDDVADNDESPSISEIGVGGTGGGDGIELASPTAPERDATALIRQMMSDGHPHPPSTLWNVSQDRLIEVYVRQPLSTHKQRKRSWEAQQPNNKEWCAARGFEDLENVFATLTRTPLLEQCGQNLWRATELWLASASAKSVAR